VCAKADWTVATAGVIFTPSWKHLIVSDDRSCGSVNKSTVVATDVWNIYLGLISPLKFELMGLAFAAAGFKFEDAILAFGAFLNNITLSGAIFMTDVAELHAAPLKKFGC
jgi:hypothetical protein